MGGCSWVRLRFKRWRACPRYVKRYGPMKDTSNGREGSTEKGQSAARARRDRVYRYGEKELELHIRPGGGMMGCGLRTVTALLVVLGRAAG